jgi:putative Holliday junction resolvase
MSRAHTTVLGFDYGTQRIGVAVGQTVSATAKPVSILASRHKIPDWSAITKLIESWAPDALVVGMPNNLDGSEHYLSATILEFVRQLQKRYRLPVYTIDESWSSYEARNRTAEHKHPKIDAVAAQVILETWFTDGMACDASPHLRVAELPPP